MRYAGEGCESKGKGEGRSSEEVDLGRKWEGRKGNEGRKRREEGENEGRDRGREGRMKGERGEGGLERR